MAIADFGAGVQAALRQRILDQMAQQEQAQRAQVDQARLAQGDRQIGQGDRRLALDEAQFDASQQPEPEKPIVVGGRLVMPSTGEVRYEPPPVPERPTVLSPGSALAEGGRITVRNPTAGQQPTNAAGGGAAPPAQGGKLSGVADMVLDNPDLLKDLTPTQRGQVLNEIAGSGASIPNQRLESVRGMASKALDSADALSKHPGFSGAFGAKGPSSLFGLMESPMGGTDAAGATQLFETLKSQIAIPNLQFLRGLGHMSDREFRAIVDASTALSRDIPEPQARAELGKIITTMREVSARGGATPETGANGATDVTGKPTAADLIRKYGGAR